MDLNGTADDYFSQRITLFEKFEAHALCSLSLCGKLFFLILRSLPRFAVPIQTLDCLPQRHRERRGSENESFDTFFEQS
jgi:hypothetical protein